MKNPKTRLFLVRHGVAEGADGLVVGQVDLPLSTEGAECLGRLARSWPGPPPDRLISSDLARAASSADVLAEHWQLPVSARDPRLREMNFGRWDGLTWDDLREQDGERLDAWMTTWWTEPAPDGESLGDVAERSLDWMNEILERHAGETVVAVAHGGSLRTLIGHALEMPGQRVFHLRLDHGQVSCLETTWRGLEVAFVNSKLFPINE